MSSNKSFFDFDLEITENYRLKNTMGGLNIGSQAVDDGNHAPHNASISAELKKLNAFVRSIARGQFMDPDSVIQSLRTKLFVAGIVFEPFNIVGESGEQISKLSQYEGIMDMGDGTIERVNHLDKAYPDGLFLYTEWWENEYGMTQLSAKIVTADELDEMQAEDDMFGDMDDDGLEESKKYKKEEMEDDEDSDEKDDSDDDEEEELDEKQGFLDFNKFSINEAANKEDARELVTYALNNAQLHRQVLRPTVLNFAKKMKADKFNEKLAMKQGLNIATEAAKMYHKEFGEKDQKWQDMFSMETRKLAAEGIIAEVIEDAFEEAGVQEKTGDKEAYQKKLKGLLKKHGYNGIGDIPDDKKDDFFNELDKLHTSDDEEKGLSEAKKQKNEISLSNLDGKTGLATKQNLRGLQTIHKQLNTLSRSDTSSKFFKVEDAILDAVVVVENHIDAVKRSLNESTLTEDTLSEGLFSKDPEEKKAEAGVTAVANEIAKKLGGKVKRVKNKDKLIEVHITGIKNQSAFENMFDPDQTVDAIKLYTFSGYFPKIEMVPVFSKSGAIGETQIRSAKDAFIAFKDMS